MSSIDICMSVYGQLPFTRQYIDFTEMHTEMEHKYYIVDDCSKDATWPFLSGLPSDKFVVERNNQNKGYLLSINKAMAKTTADYICVTNNDVLISRGCFEGVISSMEKHGASAGSPRAFISGSYYDFDPTKGWADFLDKYQREIIGVEDIVKGRIYGCCFIITRECYEELGGFDASYAPYWFEDADYIMKLREAGKTMLVTTKGFLYHYESQTLLNEKVQTRWKLWNRNKELFEKKWGVPWVGGMFDEGA